VVVLAALVAMVVTFGHWRRGWESFGLGDSASLAVAILADAFLLLIILINESLWTITSRVRVGVSRAEALGAIMSLGIRIGVLYLYGWIALRGGGSWWDLF
jgi:hypothetical protein